MRNDFKIMKDLDSHTKVAPKDRVQTVTSFAKTINSSKEVQSSLNEWKLKLDETPMQVQGIYLPPESVKLAKDEIVSAGEKGIFCSFFSPPSTNMLITFLFQLHGLTAKVFLNRCKLTVVYWFFQNFYKMKLTHFCQNYNNLLHNIK